MQIHSKNWRISADTGGTFTDCLIRNPEGETRVIKLLSSGVLRVPVTEVKSEKIIRAEKPEAVKNDDFEGFSVMNLQDEKGEHPKIILWDKASGELHIDRETCEAPDYLDISTGEEAPVVAARIATGYSPGQPLPEIAFRLAGTRTTNALLERRFPETALIITRGFRDLLVIGTQQRPDIFALKIDREPPLYAEVEEIGGRMSGEGEEIEPLRDSELDDIILRLIKRNIDTVAISLLNAWKNSDHEQRAAEKFRSAGFSNVILSSETAPLIHYLDRTRTALVNAVLTPVLASWRQSVQKVMRKGTLFAMNSAGGLEQMSAFKPVNSLLSGPAAGVAGAAVAGKSNGYDQLISFDMGGTSTDVARIGGKPDLVFEHSVGDAVVMVPAVSIETVAAGGGSVCGFDGYKLCVGPESAGAKPGPACYGAGGPLTLTDVNLLAGRVLSGQFSIPLYPDAAESALEKLLQDIEEKRGEKPGRNDILDGFLQIADERMADAIRAVSVRKGYDPGEHALLSFGGAGGQHACRIAEILGIKTVIFPARASVLSAVGLHHAGHEIIRERQVLESWNECRPKISSLLKTLAADAKAELKRQVPGADHEPEYRYVVMMRLSGQNTSIPVETGPGLEKVQDIFAEKYHQMYGLNPDFDRAETESVRVIATIETPENEREDDSDFEKVESAEQRADVIIDGKATEIPVWDQLQAGKLTDIIGPCLIRGNSTTLFIRPGWIVRAGNGSDIIAEFQGDENKSESTAATDTSAGLELAGRRLQAIANEMGEMLRRTSVSVNIKERLDYSCAVFDRDGNLVANAAHIPVHLGALGMCVRSVMKKMPPKPGDVWITNHPAYGGSHLPDVTVITPVYTPDDHLIGFSASRAHHAEIGGSRPGSMPPSARNLSEEGCIIPPMHIVKAGEYYPGSVQKILSNSRYPSRNVRENMADIEAAVAANRLGEKRLLEWAGTAGRTALENAMQIILDYGEQRAREKLGSIPDGGYHSEELMDDGSRLSVRINISGKTAEINFDGTSGVHPGNLNATPAIVHSVVMYVLRLLVNEPVPLNEGLLRAVQIQIPKGMLNPEFPDDPENCPAVVGGNTETSQRLTDTLLKPFGIAACSQGTMNNVIFGNRKFGFYETICGGTGAGPDFAGASARHHHMTNTRITDAEIMEFRYPVRVRRFAVRENSGGAGRFPGGNGVIRELEFTEPVELSILSEHRVAPPYGLNGGKPGKCGHQYLIHPDGTKTELKGTAQADLKRGDRLVIKTPGGGGVG